MNSHLILKHISNHIVFRVVYYAYVALQLRDELAKTAAYRSPRSSCLEGQPFMLWLTNLLLTYAGDILVNVLLGTLPLEPLSNVQDVLLCSMSWYLIFYSPFDVVHTMTRTLTFRVVATPIMAISQILHIDRGVRLAGRVYGNNAMVPILIVGTVIGSGAEFLKPIAALLINRCQMKNSAYVKMSTNSKVALWISWLHMIQLNQSQLLLGVSRRQLQLYTLLLLTTFKLLALAYRIDHLIWRLERRVSYALFGGLYADLNKFCKRQERTKRKKSFTKFD